jgi:hypothetical protein
MPILSISSEKVCFLIVKAREFDVQDLEADPDSGSNATDDQMVDVLEDHADNPVVQEIMTFVDEMSDDEKADVMALMQLGRADGTMEDWEALRDQAFREHGERTGAYLMGHPLLADYLEEALAQFGFSCAEFEMGRL